MKGEKTPLPGLGIEKGKLLQTLTLKYTIRYYGTVFLCIFINNKFNSFR